MITGNKESKNPSNVELVDYRKFVGVASINVLAINPNNAKLRSYGWQIADDAKEPEYVITNSDGRKFFRLRLLVQINDLDDKPVIPLDYWLGPEVMFNADKSKCKVIDSFGRTAFGTKAEIQNYQIPQYANGPASIANDYKPCHTGEEEIITFLKKYLNVTPLSLFDRKNNRWVPTKDPGHVTLDNWAALCNGNVSEFAAAIALQPENRVKVILGVRTTDDNKSYQTFIPTDYLGNGAVPDRNTGEYASARKIIDRYLESFQKRAERNHNYIVPNLEFSAAPVKEWNVKATEVKETVVEDMPDFGAKDDLDEVFGPSF